MSNMRSNKSPSKKDQENQIPSQKTEIHEALNLFLVLVLRRESAEDLK